MNELMRVGLILSLHLAIKRRLLPISKVLTRNLNAINCRITFLERYSLRSRISTTVQWLNMSTKGKEIQRSCWNCCKPVINGNEIVCGECGHLQDLDAEINYFDLLKFPRNFRIEQQELKKRFLQLQTIVHPDKFAKRCVREQFNSTEWSSLINKAYKTLISPVDRGRYLLKMHNEELPQDNDSLHKEFLVEMLERNEEVESANNKTALQVLDERVKQELDSKISELAKNFDTNSLDTVKSILVELKYILSIQNSIRKKIEQTHK